MRDYDTVINTNRPEERMDKYTADSTVIASAWNFCAREEQQGREAVFTPLEVGKLTTWRQQRLFEAAMIQCKTHGIPYLAEENRIASETVKRFLFENYGAV